MGHCHGPRKKVYQLTNCFCFLVVPEDNADMISSALIYLATNHLPAQADQDTSSVYTSGSVPVTGSLVHGAMPLQYSFNQVCTWLFVSCVDCLQLNASPSLSDVCLCRVMLRTGENHFTAIFIALLLYLL